MPRDLPRFSQVIPASRLRTSSSLAPDAAAGREWSLDALAGRLVELSGEHASACLTMALHLVVQAQRKDEPVAWITHLSDTFFPPDAAEGGVDLAALPLIRTPDLRGAIRACDLLARSGAFGLLVLDLGDLPSLSLAAQSRLSGLALNHQLTVLFLTRKAPDSLSLGSMISLRGDAVRMSKGEGLFECRVSILKDKRNGPGWQHSAIFRGQAGLR